MSDQGNPAPKTGRFPRKFLDRIKEYIPADQLESFLSKATEPLPKVVRICDPKFTSLPGWSLEKTALPETYFIDREDRSVALGNTLAHFTGQLYMASLSSLLAPRILNPEPGMKVLDLCAAPGSKTTVLAEMVGPDGLVVANELSASRRKKLAANIDRLSLQNVVLTGNDGARMHHFLDQEFDMILVDAPCSSEGYGRKSADFFRTQWNESSIQSCAKLQKQLLESAFQMLVPGGELVYSTCTSAPEENELVVASLLEKYPEAELVSVDLENVPHAGGLTEWNGRKISTEIAAKTARLYPHLSSKMWESEIFFLSKIRKADPLKRTPAVKTFHDRMLKRLPKNSVAELAVRFSKYFGIPRKIFSSWSWVDNGGEMLVTNVSAYNFSKKNKYQRLGLKAMDKHGNITTELAVRLGKIATEHVIELSKASAERFLAGYDLKTGEFSAENLSEVAKSGPFKNVYLVRSGGYGIGWAKLINGKLKNKLDRDWVISQ